MVDWLIENGSCDVTLSSLERHGVEQARLFLCPSAVDAALDYDFGVNTILNQVAAAVRAGIISQQDGPGRLAISHVVSGLPTSLKKVRCASNVINWMVEISGEQPPIAGADIVAAVFGIRDLAKAMAALKLDAATLGRAAGVDARLVHSAARNYRLPLVPALAIYNAIRDQFAASTAAEVEQLRAVFDADPRHAIYADGTGRPAIEAIAGSPDGKQAYILNAENVEPAPPTGHPWARAQRRTRASRTPALRVARQAS